MTDKLAAAKAALRAADNVRAAADNAAWRATMEATGCLLPDGSVDLLAPSDPYRTVSTEERELRLIADEASAIAKAARAEFQTALYEAGQGVW